MRHGEVDNPKDVLYGRLPRFGLSARGREQAARAAESLAEEAIAAVYSSPLLRARQTAGIIARRLGLPVRRAGLLTEVLTSWQGHPNAILKQGNNFYEPPCDPGDETIAQVFARMHRMVRIALRRHPGGRIVLVSHADPIMILRVGCLGQDLILKNLQGRGYPGRGSITRLAFSHPQAEPEITYQAVDLEEQRRIEEELRKQGEETQPDRSEVTGHAANRTPE